MVRTAEVLKLIEKAGGQQVRQLDLSHQEIEELPPEIGQLTALQNSLGQQINFPCWV